MEEKDLSLVLLEIHEMLKVLISEQEKLVKSVSELKNEQKKLQDEVKVKNFVLNNINTRSEIIN